VLSVFVEGGSRVLGSFFDARLCDMAYVFIAPLLVGGSGSIGALGGVGSMRITDGLRLREQQVRQLGSDLLLSGALGEWPWLAAKTPA
jgi:diaminohydroxyphosphoribosylaminopyrimidine deaminase / 5-amino-6-(5-phosphoribosylamino)uracil reductase